MKQKILLAILSTLLIVGFGVAMATADGPVGSGFTYQGQLNDNGSPANGIYDFRFWLYEQDTEGTPIGGDDNYRETTAEVTNGIFIINDLDFGLEVFDGNALWLEIALRPTGSGDYQKLEPRQEIKPVPYALRALNGQSGGSFLSAPDGDPADALVVDNEGNVSLPRKQTFHIGGGRYNFDNTEGDIKIGNNQYWLKMGIALLGKGAGDSYIRTNGGTGSLMIGAGTIDDVLTVHDNDRVGIGTRYPQSQLHITGGQYNLLNTEGDFKIGNDHHRLKMGVALKGKGAGNSFIRASNQLNLAAGSVHPDDGVWIDGLGRVGIGNHYPKSQLDVKGRNNWDLTNTEGDFRIGNNEHRLKIGVSLEGGGQGNVHMRSATGAIILGSKNRETLIVTDQGARVDGTMTAKVVEITSGADLSESFDVQSSQTDLTPAPGLVVCIDPNHPGELVICNQSYDHTVAGVISGAGGVQPGMVMGQSGSEADGEYPVALTGRVYVQADASTAPIRPGDLLTTADLLGHAMKITDHEQAQGAILGKAMSSLDEGQGLVLVLVSLQ